MPTDPAPEKVAALAGPRTAAGRELVRRHRETPWDARFEEHVIAIEDEAAGYDVARIEEGERSLDVARLRGAFIRAGIVWVLPAALFEEAVEVVAREYGAALAASDEAKSR